jgi:hypothetical protein
MPFEGLVKDFERPFRRFLKAFKRLFKGLVKKLRCGANDAGGIDSGGTICCHKLCLGAVTSDCGREPVDCSKPAGCAHEDATKCCDKLC